MEDICNDLSFLDFLHNPEPLPLVKKDSKSKCGISLSILFFLAYIIYEIYKGYDYSKDFKLSYSQDFMKAKNDINKKITFAFGIANELNNSIKLEFYNSTNHPIDNNLIKICNPHLKGDKVVSTMNYYCFIDYPIIGSNISGHIFEVLIRYEGELKNIKPRFYLYGVFNEPIIKHNNENPLDNSELYHVAFAYDTSSITTYRKYIKIVDYKTEGFFNNYEESGAYLDEHEDIDKMNLIEGINILGRFRFSVSKKKDIFERKYTYWFDYFISVVCGGFISIKGLFEFLTLILVNPFDKLRIFSSLNKKKPSLFNDTSNLINDYWHKKNNERPNDNNRIIIKKEFSCCDKIKLLFKCCKKNEKKDLIAVNDFIEDKLTISNTLENSIINNIKYNVIKNRIYSIQIPNEYRDREYQYLENQLKNEFPNYEAEEIKLKIKEILEEKNRGRLTGGEMT